MRAECFSIDFSDKKAAKRETREAGAVVPQHCLAGEQNCEKFMFTPTRAHIHSPFTPILLHHSRAPTAAFTADTGRPALAFRQDSQTRDITPVAVVVSE